MLSRILSRTKMSSSSVSGMLDEKREYASVDCNNTTALHETHTSAGTTTSQPGCEKKPSISFDDKIIDRPSKALMPSSPRKDSYASIKEDSDVAQSFKSRRFLFEVDHDATDTYFSLEQRVLKQSLETDYQLDEEDEEALLDDDGSSLSSLSSDRPASLETLPDEILDIIFSLVTLDQDKDRLNDPKVDLFNLLFVSKAIHSSALRVLYRHVKIPQSKAFSKFNNALLEDNLLGPMVQCLDFSSYSSIGFGRTRSTHMAKPYLTPITLKACLDKTSNLRALLVHEHIDDELDQTVLTKLFSMPSLRALDFCGCSSTGFNQSLLQVASSLPTGPLSIERLSMHECTIVRPQVYEAILPRMVRATHLDLAHTMVDDKALLSIPHTARITHLNLERCTKITGPAVVEFLTTHPAVKDSIVYLNLQADASRYRLLSEEDVTTLLPRLPSTLRSLNLGGARVNSSHVPALRSLATHLEELGLKGANLSLGTDVTHILSLFPSNVTPTHPEWQHSLRYIDLSDISSVNQMSLNYTPTAITGLETAPLEVIELGQSVLNDISKRLKNVKNAEWVVRELGRRGWYVRQKHCFLEDEYKNDDGYRQWKNGARWWGMRKIPMFEQDTGGMYGYFMFKRA